MSIKEYFNNWLQVIDYTELTKIMNILNKEYQTKDITPLQSNVFKAFHLCDYNNLNVVILGQDVYPTKGVATGIAFGCVKNIQPSLEILKECAINFEIPKNCYTFDDSLEDWEKQGVLLINSALTCEINKVGSHINIWRPFIVKLLENLSKNRPGVIYLLLGNTAQTFEPYINKYTNYIIKEKHPSYYARINKRMPDVFTKINKIVKGQIGKEINWYYKLN